MASYTSLATLKTALGIADTTEDTALQLALDSATELIDAHCNRTFTAATVASARLFTSSDCETVEIDDIYTITDLVVRSGNVVVPVSVPYVSDGYELNPINALAKLQPWTYLRHTSSSFGTLPNAISITARWGYQLLVPVSIQEACLLQASRIFNRKNSPYGIAGSPEMGSELRLLAKVDADVAVLLRAFKRMYGAR